MPTAGLAAPAATVALDTESSGCESGRLLVKADGISGERQRRRATWSDSVSKDIVLLDVEEPGPASRYSGAVDFPFVAGPVPFGIVVTLYGYLGSTPPTPATSVEFSVTYVCETLEVLASSAGPYGTLTPVGSPNYEGLWWRSPAQSESGWGIDLAHQGDIIFATWFTYDLTGRAWWLSMTANRNGDGSYGGAIYETHGPAFSAAPFDPSGVTASAIGSGRLSFIEANSGTFDYTVNGVTQTKTITRQVFGALPTCVFAAPADLPGATNYQGLWYASPAESESGWGVNFTHQGDAIFATWFTYDAQGAPLWLSATTVEVAPQVFTGSLYRTTGPSFDAMPFIPAKVLRTQVGAVTITFFNGNAASFDYTVTLDDGAGTARQTKQITRQVFAAPITICR